MQVDRQQVQQDRDALERVLAQAQASDSGVSPEALAIVGSVQQNVQLKQALDELTTKQAELRALRYKYNDAYPLVQRRLSEVATLQRQTIPTLARQLMAELSGRDAELGRRVAADTRSIQLVPPRAIDEARLQRQVTLAENLFTNLQKNYDVAKNQYHTTWSEIDVSCEACHGPGERHVQAQRAQFGKKEVQSGEITHPKKLGAERSAQVCGFCHSMKSPGETGASRCFGT